MVFGKNLFPFVNIFGYQSQNYSFLDFNFGFSAKPNEATLSDSVYPTTRLIEFKRQLQHVLVKVSCFFKILCGQESDERIERHFGGLASC
jgi:hypothetical protein